MKKIVLVCCLWVMATVSNGQVVDYFVPVGDLINMVPHGGDMCWDPGEYKQASVGNTWGFTWTSTNGGTPTSINVDWINVSDEGVLVTTTLNGFANNSYNSTGNVTCNPTGELFSLNPANYNPLGVNTVMLDYSASTTTVTQLYPLGGTYVHIEVTYGVACTDPDVPTLTASSPICPGASTTINIGGNLNDATGWVVYNDACGGTVDGGTITNTYVVTPATTTTYYIRGEGGCVTPGACGFITITVEDNTAPAPIVDPLPDINEECSSTPVAPDANDNCAGVVTATPDVSFPITTQGTTVVTWTYDDGNGNTSTQTQNVIINDVTAPVPDNATLGDVTAECSATPTAPTAADNCVGPVTGTPDVTFPITAQGTTVVTWTYDDGNGNISTQTQNVIIDDVTAPTPDNASLSDVTAECSATPATPTAMDNCAGSIAGTPDVTFPITAQGTTVVTWTYDDGNGNTTTQTQNVIIDDVTDPVISLCPGNGTFLADSPNCEAQVIWTAPTASDNCGAVTMTSSHNSGDFFPLGTTTVTYTATDGAGNTAVCSFDITVTSDLNPVVDMMTMVDCFGNSTGAIGISVFGGTAPYTYDWNSGMYTTEDISGIPAGVYNCVVTDANGCTATVFATITEPAQLDGTIDLVVNPTSCGASDGLINVSTSGGTSPYTYDWNSGTYTTEDISGLSAGVYNLTITDNNACTVMLDTTLSDPGAPSVVVDSTINATCNGDIDGEIYITVTGGTMPYTFDWDNDGTGDNDDNEDLMNVGAGSYGVVVTDATGCSASVSSSITEPAAIDVSVSQNGSDLIANGTGTYQWIDCATLSPISGETNALFTASTNGDYAVIVTDGPCSDTSACYAVSGIGFDETVVSVSIYPNPSNGKLNIDLQGYNGKVNVEVYSVNGQQLYNDDYINNGASYAIDLTVLERGTYIIRLNYNGAVLNKRVILL